MNLEKTFKIAPSGIDYALKCKRCHEELINRITDIIDIGLMKHPPGYNLFCASCKFVTSLIKEKYV